MKTLANVIPDLERLLKWVKENQDTPISCYDINFGVYLFAASDIQPRQHIAALVRTLGNTDKQPSEFCFSFDHDISHSTSIRVVTDRETVCTAKVVKKVVPATTIPAKPEQIIPEHEVEETVWDCGNILAPSEPETANA